MKKLRQEFADTMLEIGQQDPNLVVMVGDISHGILQPFAQQCPDRYFNIGICEPTIISMAAGIAKSGLTPVVHTISPFIIERGYEQIKLDCGYQNIGVNFIGVGSAFDYSQLGCSHHCYTDLSLMSHFKNACVFHPGSPIEFNVLFKQAYRNRQINYFRLTEFAHGYLFTPSDIQIGKGIRVKEGSDLTIATIGAQLKNVLQIAQVLAENDISVEVLYFPTIKPFDSTIVRESVAKTKKILVVEEASAAHGIFHSILAATRICPDVQYEQLAIEDFIHCYGSYEELCHKVGLSVEGILAKINLVFPQLNLLAEAGKA